MKKYFDRPPSTMGDWLVLAAGTALLFAAVARLPAALMALGGLLALAVGSLTAALLFALLRRYRGTANREKRSRK